MTDKKKAVFNWSGGKDSALALHKVLQTGKYEIVALLTIVDAETLCSSLHNIPVTLLQRQADSIAIPLYTVKVDGSLRSYDKSMETAISHFKEKGVNHFIFGDIYLSDVRSYREEKLRPYDIEVVEPLWDVSEQQVLNDFLNSGIRSKIVVTQADVLDRGFVGRILDAATVAELPDGTDPLGEKGEYHTFAYAGGPFSHEVEFEIAVVKKISHDINLSDGSTKTYEYWQAVFAE